MASDFSVVVALSDEETLTVTDKNGKYYYAKTISEHERNKSIAFSQ